MNQLTRLFVSAAIFGFISIANGFLAVWRLIGNRSNWIEFAIHAVIFILAGIVAFLQYKEILKERRHIKSN
jgi:uncharacterized membrane protein HdeD (DUF308 family)